ncbi:MAG: hypothetical protein VX768_18115 [Planctomycetota bacterium]|nr:hypothetical protein [Planctomycetota bacterium]
MQPSSSDLPEDDSLQATAAGEGASEEDLSAGQVRREGTGTKLSGTEPIFGGFTNTSTIICNIRLTHNGQIHSPVVDVGASVTTLAREFRFHGDAVRAYQGIIRIRSNFDSRVQQWKNEEANRLQNKKTLNGNQLRELEKEINRVRLEIARGESTLNKLQNDLDLITRVGDECPLMNPQQGPGFQAEETYQVPARLPKKKTRKALLSLARYVKPDGLRLKFSEAAFRDDFDDAIREHCYDLKNHLVFIAHWSDRNPFTRERGQIYLRLLMVPRSVEALEELDSIVKKNQFTLSGLGVSQELSFERLSIQHEKTLVEKKLVNYLHDLEAAHFQHRDLIVRKSFEFFAGDFCPQIPFDVGKTGSFLLTVQRKQGV